MEDQVIKTLKSLKSLKPEDGFISRSRRMILASEQNPARFGFSLFENMKLAAALVLASALLFIALGGLSFHLASSPELFTDSQHPKAGNVNFQIQIGEAKYNLGNATDVGLNVNEVLKNLSL